MSSNTQNDSSSTAGAAKQAESDALVGRALSASLTVNDIAKSLVWYEGVVGFTVAQKHEREGKLLAISLRAGDVAILLTQDDGAKGDRVKGEGFSLRITTAQKVDDIAARIKKHGGALSSEPADSPWGARVFRVQDPDGFKFVISSDQ